MSRRARLVPFGIAIALLAPLALAATTLINDIHNGTANESHSMQNFDAPTAAVADFDKDGVPEIVAHNDNKYVYVLSSTRARVLAEFKPDYPPSWGARPINDPAVGDVDNDGKLDIIVVNSAGRVCDFEYVSGTSTTSMSFARRWCSVMDKHDSPGADAGAVLADANGDGKLEIFSQVEKKGLYAYNHDGSLRWSKNEFGGNAGPIVKDLDGDGKLEVVFFSDGGRVKAYDASSGASKWTFHAGAYVSPASIPVAGAAADIDGDGKMEVVFSARDAPAGDTNYDDNHLMIFVLSHTGSLQKRWQPPWGNPMSYTHPVLIDVNGDGTRDILLQDWNTIGHKPGNWEKLGPANVFAYKHDGTLLWRVELSNSWSNDDLAVADVDGDGKQEVLAIGYNGGEDGVWYLDLRTGAKEAHVKIGSGWQVLRGPIAANFDGSGKTSWAASIAKLGSPDGGWRVFRTDAACNIAFGGTQNTFGCKGGSGGGGTPPPPPPGGGSFDASFEPRNVNEWWIQARVTGDRPISAVHASIDSGSWQALQLKSWGDWAGSHHAPEGSIVQLRATADNGATDLSPCYRWTATNVVSCGGGSPPPPPTGGSFDASFAPRNGNEWWIQATIDANEPLAAVDARIDNGAWQALQLKSWGDWAGSHHAPEGSIVQLRATASSGATDLSECYRWISASVVSCSGGASPPPGGGSFTASFENVRGNVWWIESDVEPSGGSLAGVDGRVDGGSWVPLDLTSWGSWAKGVKAPEGSQVDFRARATDGQTATSSTYTWPPS